MIAKWLTLIQISNNLYLFGMFHDGDLLEINRWKELVKSTYVIMLPYHLAQRVLGDRLCLVRRRHPPHRSRHGMPECSHWNWMHSVQIMLKFKYYQMYGITEIFRMYIFMCYFLGMITIWFVRDIVSDFGIGASWFVGRLRQPSPIENIQYTRRQSLDTDQIHFGITDMKPGVHSCTIVKHRGSDTHIIHLELRFNMASDSAKKRRLKRVHCIISSMYELLTPLKSQSFLRPLLGWNTVCSC